MTRKESEDRFKCPCCGENMIDPRLVDKIELIEEAAGEKLVVTSGYRCEKHNQEVGGSKTSSHLKGLAADIACDTSRPRYRLITEMNRQGINRIGIGKTFIHMDIDRTKAPRVIWVY